MVSLYLWILWKSIKISLIHKNKVFSFRSTHGYFIKWLKLLIPLPIYLTNSSGTHVNNRSLYCFMMCHFYNLDIKLAFLMWFIWGPLYLSNQKLLFTFFEITTFWGDGELEEFEECPNNKQTVSCIELDFQSPRCSLPFSQTVPTCSRASQHISQKAVTCGRKRNKHKHGDSFSS